MPARFWDSPVTLIQDDQWLAKGEAITAVL